MKHYFYFTFMLLITNVVLSQSAIDFSINVPKMTPQILQYELQKANLDKIARLNNPTNPNTTIPAPLVLNLKFYQIDSVDGTNILGYDFTVDNEIMTIVADLNTSMNKFNIFFKYRGFEILRDDITNQGIALQTNSDAFEAQHDPNHENLEIVFVNSQYGPPSALQNVFPYDIVNKDNHSLYLSMVYYWSIYQTPLKDAVMRKFLIGQQMGLLLGLFYINSGINSPAFGAWGDCENVQRAPGQPNFNADIAGDFLVDTPATKQGTIGNNMILSSPCVPNTAIVPFYDCSNPPALYINTLGDNYMDTTNKWLLIKDYNCYDLNFTAGQGARMRYMIQNSPTAHYPASPLSSSITTVESLFKPYQSTNVYVGTPVITDNNDGTFTTCTRYNSGFFKFQKGFDYIFPESINPDPLTANIDQIPQITKPTFNMPLKILQLPNNATLSYSNSGNAETICRGNECVLEVYFTGKSISSESLLSPLLEIKTLNAAELANPNFYNSLESQRIYKITKEAASGNKTEETFYKQ